MRVLAHSQEGGIPLYDAAGAVGRTAGYTDILLRRHTDFSLTAQFDRCAEGVSASSTLDHGPPAGRRAVVERAIRLFLGTA